MANLNEMMVTIELKEGIFFKLIKYRLFTSILKHFPDNWIEWIISKSFKYRAGKYGKWYRLNIIKTD